MAPIVIDQKGVLCGNAHLFRVTRLGSRCSALYYTEKHLPPAQRGLCDWGRCPFRGSAGAFLKAADSYLQSQFRPGQVKPLLKP